MRLTSAAVRRTNLVVNGVEAMGSVEAARDRDTKCDDWSAPTTATPCGQPGDMGLIENGGSPTT